MSVFVSGALDHAPVCSQRGGHPPVLCGCRVLDIPPGQGGFADIVHTRMERAITSFFRPLNRNIA